MPNTNPIDYASRTIARSPRSELFVVSMFGWAIAAAGGLICLALFALTKREVLILGGLFWLAAGGLLTLIAFVCGRVYKAQAKASRFTPPHSKFRAQLATLLPLSNAPLAVGCVLLGAMLLSEAERQFNATIFNASGVNVDDAALIFDDGRSYSFGSIAAGGSSREQTVTLAAGRIVLRARKGDQQWDRVVMEYIDEDVVRGSRVREFRIEPPP